MELLHRLSQRTSLGAKSLTFPSPDAECILKAMRFALCAPDHAGLHPARIVQIKNTEKLSNLFITEALAKGLNAEEAKKVASKATKAPALFAIIVRIEEDIEKVPPYEQWMTAGAFATNFLIGLELLGYAGKIVSGSTTRYELVRQALCRSNEVIAAWLIAGTPLKQEIPAGKPRVSCEQYFSSWN